MAKLSKSRPNRRFAAFGLARLACVTALGAPAGWVHVALSRESLLLVL
jgi:hypothetical protein